MATSNHIIDVAIVGAGGNSGGFMTEALLKTGKHTVTAITRVDSQSQLPEGVITKKVDYDKPETLIAALKGQDALVITLSGHALGLEDKILNAAAEANVPWILPNEWSPDSANEALLNDVSIFKSKPAARKTIIDLGKSSYIAVSTGFWYERSLAIPAAFGIDLVNHTATLFDEGATKISVSTWPQVGRAVAAILSLPIKPEGSNEKACLERLKDKVVYVNSFTVSQQDMLDSALRVTGTNEKQWTITKEPAQERYFDGLKEMQDGKRAGFAKMMYTRVFFDDGSGDFEHNKGTLNSLLDLPKENIDDSTEIAIERSKGPKWVDG